MTKLLAVLLVSMLSIPAFSADKCNPYISKPILTELGCAVLRAHDKIERFVGDPSVLSVMVSYEKSLVQIEEALGGKYITEREAGTLYVNRVEKYNNDIDNVNKAVYARREREHQYRMGLLASQPQPRPALEQQAHAPRQPINCTTSKVGTYAYTNCN